MASVIVDVEKVYTDGSGAPATVVADGFYFAADYVGEVRIYATSASGRAPSKRTVARAFAAYKKHVLGLVSKEWLTLNARMYAEK